MLIICTLCKTANESSEKFHNFKNDSMLYSRVPIVKFIQNVILDFYTSNFDVCLHCYELLQEADRLKTEYEMVCHKLVKIWTDGLCPKSSPEDDVLKIFEDDYGIQLNSHDTKAERIVDEKCTNDENNTEYYPTGLDNIPFNEKETTGNGTEMSVHLSDTIKIEREEPLIVTSKQVQANESAEDRMAISKRIRNENKLPPSLLKIHNCDLCDKTFKTRSELKCHMLSHSHIRPFICEICGQTYKNKRALNIHVGMHNGINPFTCVVCNKSFTQKGALQRHLPIHTGDAPYQCDLCGKRFVHHTSFNIHQRSHTGEKQYKCRICGLGLLSTSHLKRHTRVHTGERNYVCCTCGKKFAEKYNLMSHQKLHNEEKTKRSSKRPFWCRICGNSYDRRMKLELHLTQDHQKYNNVETTNVQELSLEH